MPGFSPRRTLNRQPAHLATLKAAHPLARDVEHFLIFNSTQPKVFGTRQQSLITEDVAGRNFAQAGPGGLGYRYLPGGAGGTNGGFTVPSWTDTSGGATIILHQNRDVANAAAGGSWLGLGSVGSEGDYFPFSNGSYYSNAFWNARWMSAVAGISGKSSTDPHVVALSVKSGKQLAYWDGMPWYSNTLAGGFTLPATLRMNSYNSGTSGFLGWIYSALIINRALTDTELAYITTGLNIYDLVAPIGRGRVLFSPSGGIAVSRSFGISYSALALANKSTINNFEAAGTVLKTATDRVESLAGLAASRVAVTESLGAASISAVNGVESLAGISASRVASVESLGTITVAAQRLAAVESLAAIAATKTASVESLTSLSASRTENIESTQGVSATKSTSIESLTGIFAARSCSVESLGAAAVSMLATMSIESSGMAVKSTGGVVESLAELAAQRGQSVESLASVAKTGIINAESLGNIIVSALRTVQIEASGFVSRQSTESIESSARLTLTVTVSTESMAPVVRSVQLGAESLGRVARALGVPVESLQGTIINVIYNTVNRTVHFAVTKSSTIKF